MWIGVRSSPAYVLLFFVSSVWGITDDTLSTDVVILQTIEFYSDHDLPEMCGRVWAHSVCFTSLSVTDGSDLSKSNLASLWSNTEGKSGGSSVHQPATQEDFLLIWILVHQLQNMDQLSFCCSGMISWTFIESEELLLSSKWKVTSCRSVWHRKGIHITDFILRRLAAGHNLFIYSDTVLLLLLL